MIRFQSECQDGQPAEFLVALSTSFRKLDGMKGLKIRSHGTSPKAAKAPGGVENLHKPFAHRRHANDVPAIGASITMPWTAVISGERS